jgi:hypothetical protein
LIAAALAKMIAAVGMVTTAPVAPTNTRPAYFPPLDFYTRTPLPTGKLRQLAPLYYSKLEQLCKYIQLGTTKNFKLIRDYDATYKNRPFSDYCLGQKKSKKGNKYNNFFENKISLVIWTH